MDNENSVHYRTYRHKNPTPVSKKEKAMPINNYNGSKDEIEISDSDDLSVNFDDFVVKSSSQFKIVDAKNQHLRKRSTS